MGKRRMLKKKIQKRSKEANERVDMKEIYENRKRERKQKYT